MSWRRFGPYLLVGACGLFLAGAIWAIGTLTRPTPITEAKARSIAIDYVDTQQRGEPRLPWKGRHDWSVDASHYQSDGQVLTDHQGRIIGRHSCSGSRLPLVWGGCNRPVWVVEVHETAHQCTGIVTIDAIAGGVQSASVGCSGTSATPP